MLRLASESGAVVGLDVTIFNPALDGDGSIARELVACIGDGLDDREWLSGSPTLPAEP